MASGPFSFYRIWVTELCDLLIFGGGDVMAKRGRPIKEDAMRERCILRMSSDEINDLEHLCDITGKNKTEVIKQALKVYSTALEVR